MVIQSFAISEPNRFRCIKISFQNLFGQGAGGQRKHWKAPCKSGGSNAFTSMFVSSNLPLGFTPMTVEIETLTFSRGIFRKRSLKPITCLDLPSYLISHWRFRPESRWYLSCWQLKFFEERIITAKTNACVQTL